MNLRVECLNRTESFLALEQDWQVLEQECGHGNLTASFDYLSSWWQVFEDRKDNQFGYDKELLILKVVRGSKLIAIAPLLGLTRRKTLLKVRFVEFLGQQWGATYIDLIGKENRELVAESVYNWLSTNYRFDILQLSYLPEQTPFFDLDDARATVLSACPEIDLRSYCDYADFSEHRYNSRMRNKLKARHRKLAELDYEIKVFTGSEIDNDLIMQMADIAETKKFDGKRNVFASAGVREFYRLLAHKMGGRVVAILIDGKLAAFQLSVSFNQVRFYLTLAYDRKYRNLGLGNAIDDIEMQTVDFGAIRKVSMGAGVDEYKMKFATGVRRIHTMTRTGNGLLSSLLCARKLKSNRATEREFLRAVGNTN